MAFGNATKGYVRKHSGGGGGGGTSNYNDLSNKPSINGVTLSGNKTSEDLNITNVEIIEYTGDGTRQRIHNVGQHKAVQFLTDTPTGNVMSQTITRQTVTYWETFIVAGNQVQFGTGTVTHTDTTVSLQSQDVSREFNDDGGHYMIIVYR